MTYPMTLREFISENNLTMQTKPNSYLFTKENIYGTTYSHLVVGKHTIEEIMAELRVWMVENDLESLE